MIQQTNDKFLIHVYGDSLSLPRNSIGVPFYLIYPELIRNKCEELMPEKRIYLFNMSRGSATIESVYTKLKRGTFFFSCNSDILIIQVGICDCAPRPIPLWLRNIIGKLPSKIREVIVKKIHNNRAAIQGAGIKWQMVVPASFTLHYNKVVTEALKEFDRIYVINIAPTNSAGELQSPGLSSQIDTYNKLMKGVVESVNNDKICFVDVNKEIKARQEGLGEYIYSDGHHLTLKAHQLYAQMINTDLERKYRSA